MPDESSSDGTELAKPKEKIKIEQKHLDKMRKSIEKSGSSISSKSNVFNKYLGKELNVVYKNPVKNRYKPNTNEGGDNIQDLINMANTGQGNLKMGNRLKHKLSGK
jgi:hypothetical protein